MSNKTIITFLLTAISSFMFMHKSIAQDKVTYSHTGEKYPPLLYVSNISGKEFVDNLKNTNAFEKLSTEDIGLPIGIRVLHSHNVKSDGISGASGLLAATSLGIFPIVSNEVYNIRYDVFVQGEIIETFKYQMEYTDVGSLWVNEGEETMTPEASLFLNSTVNTFLSELKESKDVQVFFTEYREYFGDS